MFLMTYVDNMTNDQLPCLIDELLDKGVNNVHVVPAFTKKGRQEHIFFIDIDEEIKDTIARWMAVQTSTIGLRVIKEEHIAFDYEFKEVRLSSLNEYTGDLTVKVKVIKDKQGEVLSVRAEYEDLKTASHKINNYTFYELKEIVESETLQKLKNKDFTVEVN